MTFLVGIGHADRVGKTTAARALVRDLNFWEIPIAEGLKQVAMRADPLVSPHTAAVNMAPNNRLTHIVHGMGDDAAKDRFPEIRRFYRDLGVGCREVLGEDVWIDLALSKAKARFRVVLPDVRFLNEAEAVRAGGGVLIKVARPSAFTGSYISETELADFGDWDLEIKNSGTIVELEQTVVDFVRARLKKR